MVNTTKVVVIINPISGTGGRMEVARARAEQAAAFLAERRVDGDVFITERPGHARELAATMLAHGATTLVAWGGDGTVNEVGSAVAFHDATLGIVPSGSGNGLARELAIPFDPAGAFAIALGDRSVVIDAGEMDGHLFFNVAGIGLDARVAHRFAAGGLVRRGFRRYAEVTARELWNFRPEDHTIVTDGESQHVKVLLIAVANARQYGNGAIIAPSARLNDGRLDVVAVAARPFLSTLSSVPKVFAGRIAEVHGVTIRKARDIQITSGTTVVYHVDGEPYAGSAVVTARSRPAALRVATVKVI
jgi:YegS/Rv2252/BmrU family lipid kinase